LQHLRLSKRSDETSRARAFGSDYRNEKSGSTAVFPLFFGLPSRPRARIPAEQEISIADNFLQKQQKQRESSCIP
jgi:hypothetical protein